MKAGLIGRRRTLIVGALAAVALLHLPARAQRAITDGVAWGATVEDLRLGVAIENLRGRPQQLRLLFQNTGRLSFTIFVGRLSFGPPGYTFKVWATSPAGKEVECFIFSTGSGFGRLIAFYRGGDMSIPADIPPERIYEIKLPTSELVKGERLSDVRLSQMLEQGYKVKFSYYYPIGGRTPDWPDAWTGGKIASGEIGLSDRHH